MLLEEAKSYYVTFKVEMSPLLPPCLCLSVFPLGLSLEGFCCFLSFSFFIVFFSGMIILQGKYSSRHLSSFDLWFLRLILLFLISVWVILDAPPPQVCQTSRLPPGTPAPIF